MKKHFFRLIALIILDSAISSCSVEYRAHHHHMDHDDHNDHDDHSRDHN